MELRYKGQTIGGGSFAGEVYSTEETRIGTYIDGRPLYRICKTHSGIDLLNNSSAVLDSFSKDVNIVSLKSIVTTTGWATNNRWFTNSFYSVKGDYFYMLEDENSKNIIISSKFSSSTKVNIVLAVEYTKTTDEPVSVPAAALFPEETLIAAVTAQNALEDLM